MNTLFDVKASVRGLLGDPDGDWVTDGYITPFINTTYKLQCLSLKNALGKNLWRIVLLQNVPVGTTSLYPFQADGKPLCGMYSPEQVWVKLAGAPVNYFHKGTGPRQLPHVPPPGFMATINSAGISWDWLGNQLLITPVNAALDIEVWAKFNPPALKLDTDILIASPDMEQVTACGAASIAGIERTNPALLAGYGDLAKAGLSNIKADLTRQRQANAMRLGRYDRTWDGYYGTHYM